MGSDWDAQNKKRLAATGNFQAQNDALEDLLHANKERVSLQKYNLDVYLSIADLFRQNLEMLSDMHQISGQLKSAAALAGEARTEGAVAALDTALDLAEHIRHRRNQALKNAIDTWYQEWFPRVAEANGRHFVDAVDNVKDHLPVRTVDMSYLVYRELLYPFDDWASQTLSARNGYAAAHHLPARSFSLRWTDTNPK